MTPERKAKVRDHKIEEYYWAGRYPCYVNSRLSAEDFDATIERLKRGEPPKLK